MYKLFNATRDATIYSQQPTQNTGLDEVLEIGKTYYGSLEDTVRTVIKFSSTEISSSLPGLIESSSAQLILRECESEEVPINYTVYAYPVSQSWDMGIGTRFDDISTDGVTWRNASNATTWSLEGGDYITIPSGSFEIEYLQTDIEMDVTNIINHWLVDNNVNNGFLLKLSDVNETGSIDFGILQYFGKETNTIYQPKLRMGWDDSIHLPGDLPELISDDIHITFKRLKSNFKLGSTVKIGVVGREKYPLKQYTKQYGYTDIQYLPSTTWYQVKDSQTDEIILPFSDYTKVSCDSNGNYFNINFDNWEANRDYYFEIKTTISGSSYYFSDDNLSFNIEN